MGFMNYLNQKYGHVMSHEKPKWKAEDELFCAVLVNLVGSD